VNARTGGGEGPEAFGDPHCWLQTAANQLLVGRTPSKLGPFGTRLYALSPRRIADRSEKQASGDRAAESSIDPQGWRGKSASEIEANVFANARDGGIALFHVFVYGDYQALGPIIQTLWDAGYRFVTISEMIGAPSVVLATPAPSPSDTPSPTPWATVMPTPAQN
jgi:hypothetical protein